MGVIEWIVTSSILIAVIIALRYALRGKMSLRLQYALWGLALLRLLLPFSIGGSSLSVMNAVRGVPVVQDAQRVSGVDQIEHMMNGSVEGYDPSDYMRDFPVVVAENKTAEEFARMERVLSLREAFIPLWLAGAAVLLAVFAVSNGRFGSRLRHTRRPLEVKGSVLPVYITDAADTPCLFGLFSPAIYVTPEAARDARILRHTVEHETTHFRHGDNFWSVLRIVCLALHWYNPLVWWAAVLSRNDAELACDEATIRRLGEAERGEYGRTLIGMTCRKPAALLTTATTMTGGRSSIAERITLLARKPKTAAYTLVAVCFLVAAAVGCTFTGAKAEAEQADFLPDQVAMMQPLSSALPPAPITDPETVDHLWGVYRSFAFDGTAETLDKENVWSIIVTFSSGEGGESECFTIFQGGICRLGEEDETYYLLLDGADIYNEFLRYFEEAKKAESAGAPLDVSAAMEQVDAEAFTDPGSYGNVTAVQLAQALNAAAAHRTDTGDGVSAGYLEGAYPYWSITAYLEGGPDSWSGTDLHVQIDCGLTENIVKVSIRKDNRSDAAYFYDEALYRLVRHHGDYDELVDAEAYERFRDILVPQMDGVYAMMSENPGGFTGYQLTRFVPVWSYDHPEDGSYVELYDFDYALLTDDPASVGLAGGMYLDSALRVQGFNGGGQFAAKYSGGALVGTAFMGNDFYYSPAHADDAEWAMERLNSALSPAER